MVSKKPAGGRLKNLFISLAAAAVLIGTIYGLYILTRLNSELVQLSAKLDSLNTMAVEMQHLSARFESVDETNARLGRVEGHMRCMTGLVSTGNAAVEQSMIVNNKLDLMYGHLAATNDSISSTANKLDVTNQGLVDLQAELVGMRRSIDVMAVHLPKLGEMRDMMASTNNNLAETTEGILEVSKGLNSMSDGLSVMQKQLGDMNTQLAVLPNMKTSIDNTHSTMSDALAMFIPIGQSVPVLNATLQEMNNTTQQMSKDMKKAPKQGAFGIAVLSAIGLAAK